jgi:hypothetical protein
VENPAQAEWLQLHGFYFLPRMKCGLLLLQIHDQTLDLIHRDLVPDAPLYPAIPLDCPVNLDTLFAHGQLCRWGCRPPLTYKDTAIRLVRHAVAPRLA